MSLVIEKPETVTSLTVEQFTAIVFNSCAAVDAIVADAKRTHDLTTQDMTLLRDKIAYYTVHARPGELIED